MTDKKLNRIIRRDKRRRRAQTFGALTGVLTSAITIGLFYGEEILKAVDNLSRKLEKAGDRFEEKIEDRFEELMEGKSSTAVEYPAEQTEEDKEI